MNKLLFLLFTLFSFTTFSQTPYQRVYTTLNTKCQNSTCHLNGCLDFSQSSNNLYSSLYGVDASSQSSVLKHEKLVKQQHPYFSFLLRKIGSDFDSDLKIDTLVEGSVMKDVNGNLLTNKEIEFIRQWIMFGAKKTYSGSEPQPNYQLVNDFYDSLSVSGINRFLPKPIKPNVGEGIQLRMGPIFLPISGEVEQEYLEQQEVNFPFLPEIDRIEGFMNQQSHHFLLFKYVDTTASTNNNSSDVTNMAKVTLVGNTSFDGDKDLTASWQNDAELVLPQGTALFWDQKTVLDMNYHIKNFNASFVLPCDFYFNIYFKPRSLNTIEMKSKLSQNFGILLPPNSTNTLTFNDPSNSQNEMRYLWMVAGHTHEWGTSFDLYQKSGSNLTKIYDGNGIQTNNGSYYDNSLGYWDWHHPPIEYWPNLLPIQFGNGNGIQSKATYYNTTNNILTFSTQTNGEMQLWYYMYTLQPLVTNIVDLNTSDLNLYPNPSSGKIHLSYTLEKSGEINLNISDVSGKVVYLLKEMKDSGSYLQSLDLNLSKGVYIITCNGSSKKLIIN